ncbi:MAG: transcriptional regulator [Anaerolineales bacterium]|nr:transcriptional regulator [Anaerolineales bacterium]
MFSAELTKTVRVWPQISDVLLVPHTEAEYERAVSLLDELIDEVGEDEAHPLASLLETLGTLIETYENSHLPEPVGDPISSLQEFMTEHNLSAADLPELGDAAAVLEILQGRQELTLPQIRALAQRFGVSPTVFV